MNDILNLWSQWLRPSAGLAAVHWAILLALASIAGYLCQRHMGMPKVVGYSLVGALAGFLGFSGVQWPLQGAVLFLSAVFVLVNLLTDVAYAKADPRVRFE